MNNIFNELDIYHHLNFITLILILYIVQKILINSLIISYKEDYEQIGI